MTTTNIMQLILMIPLPVFFALVGTSMARVLAQDGFAPRANDLIAWLTLIGAAVLAAYEAHSLTSDPYQIVSAVVGTLTLLASGALSSLKPWLVWLDILEKYAFPVIKSRAPAPTTPGEQPAPQEPKP